MGAYKRKSILILYKDGNSLKENYFFRINNGKKPQQTNKKKKNPSPLATDFRNNQAQEQFWESQIRPDDETLITWDYERSDSIEVLY